VCLARAVCVRLIQSLRAGVHQRSQAPAADARLVPWNASAGSRRQLNSLGSSSRWRRFVLCSLTCIDVQCGNSADLLIVARLLLQIDFYIIVERKCEILIHPASRSCTQVQVAFGQVSPLRQKQLPDTCAHGAMSSEPHKCERLLCYCKSNHCFPVLCCESTLLITGVLGEVSNGLGEVCVLAKRRRAERSRATVL
jgi:hypothetical protein